MAHGRSAGMARMVQTITCENAKMRTRHVVALRGLLAVQTVSQILIISAGGAASGRQTQTQCGRPQRRAPSLRPRETQAFWTALGRPCAGAVPALT